MTDRAELPLLPNPSRDLDRHAFRLLLRVNTVKNLHWRCPDHEPAVRSLAHMYGQGLGRSPLSDLDCRNESQLATPIRRREFDGGETLRPPAWPRIEHPRRHDVWPSLRGKVAKRRQH